MSAEIIRLSDYRTEECELNEIDLVTAVDVAIRDLREILTFRDAQSIHSRVTECEALLRRALASACA